MTHTNQTVNPEKEIIKTCTNPDPIWIRLTDILSALTFTLSHMTQTTFTLFLWSTIKNTHYIFKYSRT